MINIKEYRSVFFQKDNFELPKGHQEKRFVRNYSDGNLNVTESLSSGKIIKVIYHEESDIEEVASFHKERYSTLPFSLFQTKNRHTFFIEHFKDFKFQSLEIFRFNASQQETESLFFDKNYALSQYNESIYANKQDELPIKEKIFYPSLWKIEEEDMD